MKDFLFHKRDDAQPTPVVPETPETPETPVAPESLKAPEAPEVPKVPEVPEVPETPETPKVPEIPEDLEASQEEFSSTYLLEQLAAIQKDTAYLKEAMDKISLMERGDETRATALTNLVMARETTNQRLIAVYSDLLSRKNPPKMPNLDNLGKKWSDFGQKVKKSVELTPEQDAALRRQIDEAAQDLQGAAKDLKNAAKRGGESVQHYVSEAITAIRQATNGKVEIHIDRGTADKKEPGSTLDMVTEILRDPGLSTEEKELVLDHAEEIRDLEELIQTQVVEILGDPSLSFEEKELVFDHIGDIQEVDESVRAKVMEILGDVTLSTEEKELILDHLEDLQELS